MSDPMTAALDDAIAELDAPPPEEPASDGEVIVCGVCASEIDSETGEPVTDPELAGTDIPADPAMMMDPAMAAGGGAPPPPM